MPTLPEVPYDIDAERAVLGSILLNRDAMTVVAPLIKERDFYLERHARIYAAMRGCYAERVPPDLRMVAARLTDAGELDGVGGIPFLAELSDYVPTSYHAEHYARVVAGHAARRRLIDAGGRIAALGFERDREPEELLADAQSALTGAQLAGGTNTLIPVSAVMDKVFLSIDSDAPPGTRTGLHDYDALTGGLQPGDLVILAGYPGHAKTSLALSWAYNLAQAGAMAPIFSLEMPDLQLGHRLLAFETGLSALDIQTVRLSEDARVTLMGGIGRVAALPIFVDEATRTVEGIRAKALQLNAERGAFPALFIDYLQLLAPPGGGDNRARVVGDISRQLKALAKELSCSVVAISSLRRPASGTPSEPPGLADMRESGQIEYDADKVIAVWREEAVNPTTEKAGIIELHFRKFRGGPLSALTMRFDGPTTRVDNLTTYREMKGY